MIGTEGERHYCEYHGHVEIFLPTDYGLCPYCGHSFRSRTEFRDEGKLSASSNTVRADPRLGTLLAADKLCPLCLKELNDNEEAVWTGSD